MISLADIAFLIIFFFMVTSSFMRDTMGVVLPVLSRSDKTDSEIMVMVDKEKAVYLNGQLVGSTDALERELKGLIGDKKGAKETEVRLRCDRTLKYADYRGVFEAISRAGGVIAIMHELPR
jgi:biopolymer transport protein ExbD